MEATSSAGPRFTISFPESASKAPLDGRLLLLISTDNSKEPRFQISEDLSTQQVFGVDIDGSKPGQAATIDSTALGYPVRSLSQIPAGEYWVQALLHRYETFKRKDGHTVKLPPDRGEGQQWSRAPGNLYSTPRKIKIDPNGSETISLSLDQIIPPIEPPKDTKYVKTHTHSEQAAYRVLGPADVSRRARPSARRLRHAPRHRSEAGRQDPHLRRRG